MITQDIEKLFEKMKSPEPLDPELEKCKVKIDGAAWVKHPLVFSPFHIDAFNFQLNGLLNQKKKFLQSAIAHRNGERFVWQHERAYRLDAFVRAEMMKLFKTEQARLTCLRNVWTDSENIYEEFRRWGDILDDLQKASHREKFMGPKNFKHFQNLPEAFTVYRGCLTQYKRGLSWTRSKERAQFFARRTKGKVYATTIRHEQAIAYLDDRNEEEIIWRADLLSMKEARANILLAEN